MNFKVQTAKTWGWVRSRQANHRRTQQTQDLLTLGSQFKIERSPQRIGPTNCEGQRDHFIVRLMSRSCAQTLVVLKDCRRSKCSTAVCKEGNAKVMDEAAAKSWSSNDEVRHGITTIAAEVLSHCCRASGPSTVRMPAQRWACSCPMSTPRHTFCAVFKPLDVALAMTSVAAEAKAPVTFTAWPAAMEVVSPSEATTPRRRATWYKGPSAPLIKQTTSTKETSKKLL